MYRLLRRRSGPFPRREGHGAIAGPRGVALLVALLVAKLDRHVHEERARLRIDHGEDDFRRGARRVR